jgi:HJR/Mrr/RecB family endonuclease
MTGREFEEFLARLFSRMGYTNISLTPANDQGGDLVCVSPGGTRIVVQAKRWRGSVGNAAVMELLGGMLNYECTEGIVVTNSTFTAAARELAAKDCRSTLRDGHWLQEQIIKFLPAKIPDFDWEEYNRIVRDYKSVSTRRKRRSVFRWHKRRPRY